MRHHPRHTPCPRRLAEAIRGRGKIGLREALRLRDLGVHPFAGAVVFTMRADDEVEAAGGLDAQVEVSAAETLALLETLLAAPALAS
ncbi:hypothetical protein NK718_03220 [Alsobacter sp. SYSU M60028]|uniref:Uncharacterized protein n=1 Tax=Alsobacter ponti TaxID=2962936 RepID=A0ABT1L7P9_9HYPH|nr:hypothetical protein [Alsobacter ponti]MCP8937515.1 hypothetical protein [Alsobacter ponti]